MLTDNVSVATQPRPSNTGFLFPLWSYF